MKLPFKTFGVFAQPREEPAPLLAAAAAADDAKIAQLLKNGANPLEKDAHGRTALDIVQAYAKRVQDNFQAFDDMAAGEPEIMLARARAAEKILQAAQGAKAEKENVARPATATSAPLKILAPLRLKAKRRP